MCRNIRTLHNFEPPATEDEIRASALQFVRKLSGFAKPSKTNEPAFNRAVEQVTRTAQELLDSLVTNSPRRDRELEAEKARTRSAERFGGKGGAAKHTHAAPLAAETAQIEDCLKPGLGIRPIPGCEVILRSASQEFSRS